MIQAMRRPPGGLLGRPPRRIVPARPRRQKRSPRHLMLSDNISKKTLEKKTPAKIIHEDDLCAAFHDVNPQAPVHVLIIPKKVIRTHDDVTAEDAALLAHLHLVAIQ